MVNKVKRIAVFVILIAVLTFGTGIKGKSSQVDGTSENTEITKSKSKNGRSENAEVIKETAWQNSLTLFG